MSREELSKSIITYAGMAFNKDPETITEASRIKEDLGSQSILMVSLISNIENELDIMLSLSEAGACKTIGELVDKVEAQM